jgi:hypothetical protein
MDISTKKVELIEWLARLQDESLIHRIDMLKKNSAKEIYEQRMSHTIEQLEASVERSESDLAEGKVHTQEEVESYFKARFK